MRWSSLVLVSALLAASSSVANPVYPSDDQVALGGLDGPVKTTDKWSYTDCGKPEYPIQLQSIEVFPDPPKPGKDLTVKVKATVVETIEDGAFADVLVKLGLVKLLSKEFDVCEEARNNNVTVQCPIVPGTYTVEHTVALPREIPRGKFMVSIDGYTVDEDPMLCLRLNVDFIPAFPRPHRLW